MQGSREAVYDYLASKLALYKEAYGELPANQLPFPALRDAVIRGLAMPNLRRAVYRLDPKTEAELHTFTLQACSDEAILWSMGASESSSLTGIGPIGMPMRGGGVKSFGSRGQRGNTPKPPGRGRGSAGPSPFPKGTCYECGSLDHWVADCPQATSSSPSHKTPKPQVAAARGKGRGKGRGGQRGGGKSQPKKRGGRGGQGSVRNVDEVGQEAGPEEVVGTTEQVSTVLTLPHWDDQWSSGSD